MRGLTGWLAYADEALLDERVERFGQLELEQAGFVSALVHVVAAVTQTEDARVPLRKATCIRSREPHRDVAQRRDALAIHGHLVRSTSALHEEREERGSVPRHTGRGKRLVDESERPVTRAQRGE